MPTSEAGFLKSTGEIYYWPKVPSIITTSFGLSFGLTGPLFQSQSRSGWVHRVFPKGESLEIVEAEFLIRSLWSNQQHENTDVTQKVYQSVQQAVTWIRHLPGRTAVRAWLVRAVGWRRSARRRPDRTGCSSQSRCWRRPQRSVTSRHWRAHARTCTCTADSESCWRHCPCSVPTTTVMTSLTHLQCRIDECGRPALVHTSFSVTFCPSTGVSATRYEIPRSLLQAMNSFAAEMSKTRKKLLFRLRVSRKLWVSALGRTIWSLTNTALRIGLDSQNVHC